MKTMLSLFVFAVFAVGSSGAALADAADIYGKKCASCHGKDGKADTAMGKKLNMRSLADPKVQAASTDEQIEKLILEGVRGAGGKNAMPATKLPPEEAKALVKLVRTFKK